MKIQLSLIAATGCVYSSEPYPVEARANLQPLAAQVSGPLELLGSNQRDPIDWDGTEEDPSLADTRVMAAYRVSLPDTGLRRVRIYEATSCDVPQDSLTALDVIVDLDMIGRVGDETHFFIGGVDVQTVATSLSLAIGYSGYIGGQIAVVQALDDENDTPGEWHACGVFEVF